MSRDPLDAKHHWRWRGYYDALNGRCMTRVQWAQLTPQHVELSGCNQQQAREWYALGHDAGGGGPVTLREGT